MQLLRVLHQAAIAHFCRASARRSRCPARAHPSRARRLLSWPGRTPTPERRAGPDWRASAPRFDHSSHSPDQHFALPCHLLDSTIRPSSRRLRQFFRRRRRNGRRESVLSSNHRLLGEDARHRALRRCLGDRGQEGRGEVAGGVDAGHAGLAALVDLEDDAGGRIDRGEAQ